MGNKERSKAIRAALKEKGITSKQVSVRSGYCTYSSYTDITIKDMSVRINDVKRICNAFESVRYDEYSGEILAGGNTYIQVQYDYNTLNEAIEKQLATVEELIKNIDKEQIKFEKNGLEYVLFFEEDCQNFKYFMACSGSLKIKASTLDQFKYSLARAFATDFEDFKHY